MSEKNKVITREEATKLSIYEKLLLLKEEIPYIQKQAKQYIKFTVVESSDVLQMFRPFMDKLGLILEPSVANSNIERIEIGTNKKTDKTIFSYLVHLEMEYVWVNVDNPSEKEVVKFVAIADDENSSYAFGQAMTYAEKTFLLKYFNIPTDDSDPDVFQQEVLKRVPAQEEQIESLYILVDKVRELTGQTKKVVAEQAKVTAKVNLEKSFDDYTAYEFGLVSNVLNGWEIAYSKKAEKVKKAKEKAESEEKA